MLLLVDNGSAYTGELAGFLGRGGVPFERGTPASLAGARLGAYDSFILSGRRRGSRESNRSNSAVVRHAVGTGSKLLGICYGAEILALALGGGLRRTAPRTGPEQVTVTAHNPLAEGTISVHESHSLEISRLPEALVPLAGSPSCRHEMIRHRALPIFGTQFHPEMSPDGLRLIGAFCSL